MSEEIVLPIPNLELPQTHFVLTQENLAHLHHDALKTLMAGIEKDGEQVYLFQPQQLSSPCYFRDGTILQNDHRLTTTAVTRFPCFCLSNLLATLPNPLPREQATARTDGKGE